MPLNSPLKPWHSRTLQGMNHKYEVDELDVQKTVLAQNCRFEDEPGAVVKRPPYTFYNSTSLGAGAVLGAYRLYLSDGTVKTIAVWGTTCYVGTDATGALTSIRTNLTTGKRMSFVTYKDLVYCSNGYDNIFIYDGASDNVTWEMGACKAVLGSGAGNLDASADYYYAVTIDDDAYICGAVSNTVSTDGSNQKIELSNIPLGPSGTTNRKIYRTEGDGSTLKLLTTISDNTTTTYSDNTADGSLGATMGAVTDDVPKGKKLKLHRERLFVTGDPNAPNRIYYSNVYLPHYIQQTTNTDYMDVAADDGDEIMDIPIQLGVMVCIKRNTIRKLHITTPVGGADPTTWYAEDPVAFEGSPAPWSITQTPYGIIMLGWEHWKLFDGARLIDIIDEFDTQQIVPSKYSDTVGHWHQGIFHWTCTDTDGGTDYHNKLYRYNWRRKAMSVDDIAVNCFYSYEGDDETGELYYGASDNGYLYQSERDPIWIRYQKKTQIEDYDSIDEIFIGGTENAPFIEIGWGVTIDNLAGTIDARSGTIDMPDTDGTYTFKSQELNVGTFNKLYWNQTLFHASDTVQFYIRTGASQAACEAAAWGSAMTDPNGSSIGATADTWMQMKIELSANSTAGSPRVYFADGYVVRFNYYRGLSTTESSVNFIYQFGLKNLTAPDIDKIFKKIISHHEGDTGTFTIDWETEYSSGTFTVDLTVTPTRWESFFPSTAFGRRIDIKLTKNDLNDFKIKEIKGWMTPEPLII